MTNKEKTLFFELCKFKNINKEKIEMLINKNAATPAVLGELFSNRMAGIAYKVLAESGSLFSTNREFRNALKDAYLVNIEKNNSFFNCLNQINEILKDHYGKYALLKGAYLCSEYPIGCRTSNDIDILVNPEHISEIGNALKDAGFFQGHIKNDTFIPATRSEIIQSRIMNGETVPYIKEVDLPFMQYLEIDINFSLDYKNGSSQNLSEMISRAKVISTKNSGIVTLDKYDFIIHLCEHLYKEATTMPWIKMKRDMTLYKYCDLYYLLQNFGEFDSHMLISRIKFTNTEDTCYYAIASTKYLFNNDCKAYKYFFNSIIPSDPRILERVENPSASKPLFYKERNIKKRFFSNNRLSLIGD